MPCYVYECVKCGNKIESIEKINKSKIKICPLCSYTMKRIISLSNFSLKGGGWEKDGYSSKKEG